MSLRDILKRHLPHRNWFKEHQQLRWLGELLHDHEIWHLSRRSAAGGVATGLFCAAIPLPVQMLTAAVAAIYFRVNLPLAVICTWVTNPITVPPVFFFIYKLGSWLLQRPAHPLNFQPTPEWLMRTLVDFWEPMLLGSLIVGSAAALAGYLSVSIAWRVLVIRKRDTLRHNPSRFKNGKSP
jgi:uncharacterized protein (DUF2062 family)